MTTESYSQLLGGMWAPEGSDINQRLQRLQELERLRKEREAKRQMKQSDASTTSHAIRSRLRSSQSDTENDSSRNFELGMGSTFGGARPKLSSTRAEPYQNTAEDWDQIFQSVTGNLLSKPTTDSQSRFRRNYARSDSGESSGYSDRYRSSYRTYDRPAYTSQYNRSNSQPEEQSEDVFSGVTASLLGKSKNTDEPGSYRRRYERNNEEIETTEGEEQPVENGEHQTEEVIEIQDDDDSEEPVVFIERLKKGYESDNNNNDDFGSSQKRGVNGYMTTNVLTVPPLKKMKPGETDETTEEEQYEEVTKYIHPVEDIIAVAKDINAAFGSKSPKSAENTNGTETGFSFKSSWMAENERLNSNGDFVFTASTPDSSTQKQRVSGTKRKQRSITKGKNSSGTYSSPKKGVQADSVANNADVGNDADSSVIVVSEEIVLPNDSYVEEQEALAADTEDLYKSRLSTYMDLDQTKGQLDEMQEYFSGKEVRGDPAITRLLCGDLVKYEMSKTNDDTTLTDKRKRKEEEKPSKMSIDERLSKLKSMTDEKSKRQSVRPNEIGQKDLKAEQIDKNTTAESVTSQKYQKYDSRSKLPSRDEGKGSETKNSPRGDLVNNVRELKKFIHESVSEPSTPILETQISIEKRLVKEISTQTDNTEIIYICKHCGKSSADKVDAGKKPEATKTSKLDLRLETKNPNQNYAQLEQSHLAEIKKEMKASNKSLNDTDTKKSVPAANKPNTASATPSYMKSTASSSKKTNNNTEKVTRKGSAPDINKIRELEAQRKSPVAFLRSKKNIVAERAKAFGGTDVKTGGKEKSKPGLSVYRGTSTDRQKTKGETTASALSKSKSLDQMSMVSEDKSDKKENSKKLVKQKSVGDELERAEKPEGNVPSSPGLKGTRTQMSQKTPPAVSPKPVRKTPPPLSPKPVRTIDSGRKTPPPLSPKPVRTIDSGLSSPIVVSPLCSKENKPPSGVLASEHVEVHLSRKVETEGQFTTLQDNPFIKNDYKRTNSIRGRKEGESVWEREKSRSRESLKRSNTIAGERASLTRLSWSDSGSAESLPAYVSGSKSNIQRSQSERRGSTSSITSQNSVLNLLDPKGTKTNVVTGIKETNVDEAYEEYIASRNNSVSGDSPDEKANDSGLIEFAQKTLSLLEFEPKKRDSSSDSTETEGKVTSDPRGGKSKQKIAANGTSQIKNGVANNTTTANEKAGKKPKQRKGFFKGRLFNK